MSNEGTDVAASGSHGAFGGYAVGDGWGLLLDELDPGGGGGWPDEPGGTPPPVEPPAEPPVEEIAVAIYSWVTQADGRVCPLCGPLDGLRWEGDEGPWPPLHVGCRCERRLVAVEWRTRRLDEAMWTWH